MNKINLSKDVTQTIKATYTINIPDIFFNKLTWYESAFGLSKEINISKFGNVSDIKDKNTIFIKIIRNSKLIIECKNIKHVSIAYDFFAQIVKHYGFCLDDDIETNIEMTWKTDFNINSYIKNTIKNISNTMEWNVKYGSISFLSNFIIFKSNSIKSLKLLINYFKTVIANKSIPSIKNKPIKIKQSIEQLKIKHDEPYIQLHEMCIFSLIFTFYIIKLVEYII